MALLLPLGIVTLAGTLAADELSLRVTTTPPLGAGPLNVTVPVEVAPPLTLVGLSESLIMLTVDGFTVNVAVFVIPAYAAEMVTELALVTA